MNKKIVCLIGITILLMALTVIFVFNSFASEVKFISNSVIMKLDTNKMLVNGQEKMVDSQNPRTMPYLDENSRTLVPIRCISENLGADVQWIDEDKVAIININNSVIKFKINDNKLNKDNIDYAMDTKAIIYEDRTYIPLRALIEIGLEKQVYWDKETQIIVISDNNSIVEKNMNNDVKEILLKDLDSLSIVGNFEVFKKLVINNDDYRFEMNKAVTGSVDAMNDATSNESATSQETAEYSKTNTQVEGVDEADIVKTDGKYIYYITSNKLIIVDATKPNDISIIKEIKYNESDKITFSIEEMFLDNNKLVVIGNEYEYKDDGRRYNETIMETGIAVDSMYYYPRSNIITKAICYDVSDPNNIEELRTIKADGSYISSRKVNDEIYLVSNKNIYVYDYKIINEDDVKPEYYDSVVSENNIKIEFDSIKYFPEIEDNSYSLITSFSIKNNEKAKVETFLGMSDDIYMDEDNLYVASCKYNYRRNADSIYDTTIYKFDVLDGIVEYNSKANVCGTLLNQFAMDEYNGYFRIAVTNSKYESPESWWTIDTNELYIFNNKMKEVSNITNIAKDERIYSVRFMQDRAYIVTYRQVDPLFVVDLSDPLNPEILGQLKIEGYSTYLHPYDQNHIIGFGIDTKMIDEDDIQQKGMKIAMFDVTNPSNPIQMYTEIIGDNGTTSPLIYSHKALLFDKEKGILAFPIIIGKYNDNTYNIENMGAIIYKVSLENGFEKQGVISHAKDIKDVYRLYGEQYNDLYASIVDRIIYINDDFYTLSPNMIKCSSMSNLKEISKVNIQVDKYFRVRY